MKKINKIKRILGAVFIIGMLLNCNFIADEVNLNQMVAYADTVYDGCEYKITSENSLELIKCNLTSEEEVAIPEKIGERVVVSIGADAFSECKSLMTIKIPKSVTNITEGSLTCPKLNMIIVEEGNEYFASTEDGILIDVTTQKLIQYPSGKIDAEGKPMTEYTIPEEIITISRSAFKDAKNLQTITFNEKLQTISAYAFSGCTGISEIFLPETIKTIDEYAFYGCSKLTTIHLGFMESKIVSTLTPTQAPTPATTSDPSATAAAEVTAAPTATPEVIYTLKSSLETLGNNVFEGCTSLASIKIPNTCKSIGEKAFYGCKALSDIVIDGNGVAELKLGKEAFAMCTNANLVEITLPSSVTTISERAFYGSGGKNFIINLSDEVKAIEPEAFAASKIIEVKIPRFVKTLSKAAFKDCKNLVKAQLYFVEANTSMETIEEEVFYNCTSLESLTLPVNIKTIGARAFYGTKLSKIDLPGNLTEVSEECFYNCKTLEEMTIPSKVTSIAANAFGNCTKLTEINVEGNVTTIGDQAFYGCSELTDFNLAYPDAIETMGPRTFAGCKKMKSIVFSKNMTEIPDEMFKGCVALESVNIPRNIKKVGNEAFSGCTGMTSLKFNDIDLDNVNNYYALELGEKCFYGCKALAKITLSNNIENIPDYCFYQAGVTSIEIPKYTKTVGASAFEGATALKSLTLNNGVESIGVKSFYGCKALETVTFSNTMTEIPENAFANTAIKNLIIPANIASVGNYAFNKCTSLETIVCEDGVKTIGDYCFASDSAVTSVNLGNTVESIGTYAFSGLSKLEEFIFSPKITSIEANTFNKSFNSATDKVLTIPSTVKTIKTNAFNGSNVPAILVEDGLETIETLAFNGCKALKSIVLPTTITELPDSTFVNCTGLESITIPGNVKKVGAMAFSKCTALKEAVMEEGVEEIGDSIFVGCKALETVSIPSTLTKIPANAFNSCTGLATIEIPGTVKEIGDNAFVKCTALTDVVLKDGIETLGIGVFDGCKLLKNVTFSNTMTEIPQSTFASCAALETITIPSNIKTIGNSAFSGCKILAEVVLEEGVERIEESAFEGCKELASVTFPESLSYIGPASFSQAALTSIEIPAAVKEICESAFEKCLVLTDVVLNEGTEKIGEAAFASCKAIENINFPQSITEIGAKAFNGCTALATPDFPYGLTTIGESAFSGCTLFDKLIFPENLTSVGKNAFSKCSNLTSATFAGDAPTVFDKTVFASAHTGFRTYHYVGTEGFDNPWYGYMCEEIDISTIKLVSEPKKKTYIDGECSELDRTGMQIIALYSNGDERDVTSSVEIKGFDGSPATLGEQNIEISYPNTQSVLTFKINVIEKQLLDINITQLPDKTEFLLGSDLDTTGMIITATYDNGKTGEIPVSECTLSGYSKTSPGTQTISVKYTITKPDGTQMIKTAKFQVEVIDRTLTGITVKTNGTVENGRVIYSQGAEFDVENTEVIALYDNGDNDRLSKSDYEVIGFDSSILGESTIVIKFNGFTYEMDISVVEKSPIKLNVSNYRTEYIKDETFGEGDAVVEVEYDNGEIQTLPFGEYEAILNLQEQPYNCTINYKNLSFSYSVTIVEKVLTEITITEPTKTMYAIGEEFDATGLTVTAVYNNGSTEDIKDYTIDGFDSSKAQDCIITVIYQNKYKNFNVTVSGNSLIDIDVASYTKTYQTGDKFDMDTMKVYAVYSDNSRVEIDNYTIEGFDSSLVGTKDVTVSYSGITKKIPVTIVSQSTVTSLTGITVDRLTSAPYIVGETYFNRSSIIVSALYSDGSKVTLKDDEYTILGFDTSSPGTSIVTVSYLGYTKPVAIQIVAKSLINVAFIAPTKTIYSVGEAIDKTGMNLLATYDDGTNADVTANAEISGFDTSSAGRKTVRVSYMGITKTFDITVIGQVNIMGITVTDYTRTYAQYADFDKKLTVYASFSDGSVEKVDSGYEISGFDSSKSGVSTVTVTYMEKTASFDVIIIPMEEAAEILDIDVSEVYTAEYIVGATGFDRSSISVSVIKSDGTVDVIDNYSVLDFDTSSAGNKVITISYLTFKKNIVIKVTDKSLMGISVKAPNKTTYTEGDKFDTTGMNVMAFYTDGSQSDVTGQVMINGFDSSIVGTQTVTVVYGEKSYSFDVVIEPSLSSLCSITLKDARISRSNNVTTEIVAVNTTEEVVMGSLVVAIYEKTETGAMGKLVGMSITDAIIPNGETTLTPSFSAGDTVAEEFIVTAYLWSDMLSMQPITEKSTFEI